MRIPRDISGAALVAALKAFGYAPTRQSGSHIRLSTATNGAHHLTVPNHNALRVGTLNGIISEVASRFQIPKDEVTRRLFG